MGVIDELLGHNQNFAAGFNGSGLTARPELRLAVLTCMDARLQVEALLGLQPGHANILRNAGGVASEDALRSLLLSTRMLEVRHVLVIGHTHCGLHNLDEAAFFGQFVRDVPTASPPPPLRAFEDLAVHVRQQVARVREFELLPPEVEAHGLIYDVETGLLRGV